MTQVGRMLFVTDLDGTLLDPNGVVEGRSEVALRRLSEAGVVVAVATGRRLESARRKTVGMEFLDWIISSNGAVTFDAHRGLVSRVSMISEPRTLGVLNALAHIKLADCRAELLIDGLLKEVDARDLDPDATRRETKLVSMSLDVRSVESQESLGSLVQRLDGLCDVHRSSAPRLDLTACGVSKASALRHLCRRVGIARSDTIACGDNSNDAQMLRWANLGVAVSNASDEVLALADAVTHSSAEFGVARLAESILSHRD